jgi:hypothetical protein
MTFPLRRDFSWEKVEKKVPKSQIDQFIQSTPKEFELYRGELAKSIGLNLDNLVPCLHFLDINGDNRLDVIYDGRTAGEGAIIEIFVNLGDTYKKVFSEMQSIFKLDWLDNKLYRLYIYDGGCCDDPLEFKKIYQAVYSKTNKPDFVQMYQGTGIGRSELPDTLLERPIRFEVLNDNYKIRSFPDVDDVSRQPWDDGIHPSHGNWIGKLSKGARGTAFGKKTDKLGREWWYVEIDEEFYPSGDVLLKEEENEFPTKVIGWISSRFVKEL